MGHRPFYCSPDFEGDDCHQNMSVVRDGLHGQWPLVALFHRYGVDLQFAGHEHDYQRTLLPVYH